MFLETSYEVGLNMTNVEWTDDLYNTSSAAYQELLAKFIEEVNYTFLSLRTEHQIIEPLTDSLN